jgi:hypothetical protein
MPVRCKCEEGAQRVWRCDLCVTFIELAELDVYTFQHRTFRSVSARTTLPSTLFLQDYLVPRIKMLIWKKVRGVFCYTTSKSASFGSKRALHPAACVALPTPAYNKLAVLNPAHQTLIWCVKWATSPLIHAYAHFVSTCHLSLTPETLILHVLFINWAVPLLRLCLCLCLCQVCL